MLRLQGLAGAPSSSLGEPEQRGSRSRHSSTWQCQLCTFAGNDAKWLRCEVCDNLRGSTLASSGVQQQPSSAARAAETEDTAGGQGRLASAPEPRVQQSSLGCRRMQGPGGQAPLSVAGQTAVSSQQLQSKTTRPPSSEGAGAAAGADADQAGTCPECGQHISAAERQEHADWHFAVKLQEPGRASAPLARPPPTAKRKKPAAGLGKRAAPANMTAYLKRKS